MTWVVVSACQVLTELVLTVTEVATSRPGFRRRIYSDLEAAQDVGVLTCFEDIRGDVGIIIIV
jgi:hypothetical protein